MKLPSIFDDPFDTTGIDTRIDPNTIPDGWGFDRDEEPGETEEDGDGFNRGGISAYFTAEEADTVAEALQLLAVQCGDGDAAALLLKFTGFCHRVTGFATA